MRIIQTTGVPARLDWRSRWRRITSVRPPEIKDFMLEVLNSWNDHHVPRLGASVAFYTLLSLAPLLLIVVAIAGAVFGRDAAEGQLVWQIQDLIGTAGAETVQNLLRTTQQPGAGLIPSVIGTAALAIGASSAVSELRDALNVIWCVPKRENSGLQSILEMLREKGLAFATVLGIGFLLLISLAVNTTLAAVTDRYRGWFPTLHSGILQWVDFIVAFLVIALLFAVIYKWLPDLRLEWGDVIPGAMITALLFSLGRWLIGLYLGRASYGSAYGAAGSLVVVLVWVYYSAQIFFFGAEFTRAWAQNYGSKPCDNLGKHVQLPGAADGLEPDDTTSSNSRVHLS
ncbi:MAG: YihY/virulence factor BrkB family protein [Bryobacteraceae bacterium]|nr:YihY/virulence factor BrkB family protein [Bryobacteraceae bacterium]